MAHPDIQTKYIPLTDWPKHHPWPPLGGLRHLVFHAKTNRFDSVIRRVGRRVLLDEQAFYVWMSKQDVQQESKNDEL